MKLFRSTPRYFIAAPSRWPIYGCIGLFLSVVGLINILHNNWYGHYLLMAGMMALVYMMFHWFQQRH